LAENDREVADVYYIGIRNKRTKMKQLLCLAVTVVLLSSCDKQRVCTCTTGGSTPHEILGLTATECQVYAEKVAERRCTYDD
ncbi:MAG TPA: hypothetical protein VEB40_12725, partial [Flavipsychrobacter sp.]|nr:hypothetical protein [Flavipsychrobacter sp.]